MTLHDGFDRTVSDWLDERAGRGTPGYLDEVLTRTSRTRQRPWWSSLERLLPMQSTARFAQVPRAAWLLVVLGLIVALGTAILVAGSPRRPPSPFGPAAHGNVLYAGTDGDIYTIDTATNVAHPVIVGPASDSGPLLSPDGTMFAFTRRAAESETTATYVANADGSAIRAISGTPDDPTSMAWSPDGAKLAVVAGSRLSIAVPDSAPTLTGAMPLPETATIEYPQWRPNGHELIFYGSDVYPAFNNGIYLVEADGSGTRAIVGPTFSNLANPALSPDGTEVAYADLETDQIHVVNVDTGVDRRVAFDGAGAEGRPRWSPDGTKLVFERSGVDGFQLMIGSVDGGPVTAIGPTRPVKTGGAEVRYGPDGTRILAFYNADRTSWVLDPSGGPGTKLDYDAVTPLSWQQSAP